MLTIVIGDIHGMATKLENLLGQIDMWCASNARAELRQLIFLGDYIDRGPNSRQVLRMLARSVADLQDIVRTLKSKSVSLKATDQPIDTASAAGKAFLDMLGVFAEFETSLRKERQMEGITKAKAAGVYKGRRPSIDVGAVIALKSQGKGASEISQLLGIGRASVYRATKPKMCEPSVASNWV